MLARTPPYRLPRRVCQKGLSSQFPEWKCRGRNRRTDAHLATPNRTRNARQNVAHRDQAGLIHDAFFLANTLRTCGPIALAPATTSFATPHTGTTWVLLRGRRREVEADGCGAPATDDDRHALRSNAVREDSRHSGHHRKIWSDKSMKSFSWAGSWASRLQRKSSHFGDARHSGRSSVAPRPNTSSSMWPTQCESMSGSKCVARHGQTHAMARGRMSKGRQPAWDDYPLAGLLRASECVC